MEAVPIVFFKTFEQRLSELKEILYDRSEALTFSTSSRLKELWITYIDLNIEPVGWQALWKINRELCAEFKLKFPTNVVAMVKCVHVNELSADINITNVESNIDIPERFAEVPLTELFPIFQQDNDDLLILGTAEVIDHLRMFYCHLFYPWEEEDCETSWVEDCLENRLRLHYEMMSSKIYHETADELTNLIKKGKQTYQEIKEMEEIVIEKEDLSDDLNTLKLFELNHALEHIKNQLTIFDNPTLRDLKMKENRVKLVNMRENHGYFTLVVLLGGEAGELIHCLAEVKLLVNPESFLCPLHSLQQAFNMLIPNETILIGPGIHHLQNSKALQENNSGIKGIVGADKCIITEQEDNLSLFDLRGPEVKCEDLTFQSSRVQYLIVVRQGVCRLNKVVLRGYSSAVGVMVHRGATLYATRCNFVSCTTGLVANPGSIVILTECTFNKNKTAIEVQENSDVMIDSCVISDSEEYAIQLNQSEMPRKEGTTDLLSVSGSINAKDLTLFHNFGDVLVESVKPTELEDLKTKLC